MNNINDQYILEKVKELYTSFPSGTIKQSKSPDFIVKGSRNVGIEVTQIFHNNFNSNIFKSSIIPDKTTTQNHKEGAIPNLKAEHLQLVLDKKEKAKKDYKECDEYWLLIQEGSFYDDSFEDIEITKPPHTSFDKVLLYRQSENLIVQLK